MNNLKTSKVLTVFLLLFAIMFTAFGLVIVHIAEVDASGNAIVAYPGLMKITLSVSIAFLLASLVLHYRISHLVEKNKRKLLQEQKDKLELMTVGGNQNANADLTQKTEINEADVMQGLFAGLSSTQPIEEYSRKFLINIARHYEIVQGMFFVKQGEVFSMISNYAFYAERSVESFKLGEGITGQVAKNKELIRMENVPENYITIVSGLGSSSPKHLLVFPIIKDGEAIAIIELASFKEFPLQCDSILTKASEQMADYIAAAL